MKWDGRLALVLAAGAALAFIFHALHLPAAWLFGPLAVSAFFAVRGWKAVQFPNGVYLAGQAAIGTALGAGFSPETLGVLPHHLAIFSFAVVFILLTSLLNGWLLARYTRLNAATAFLGTMPGGAGVMAAMSDSLGADTRLVTAVQYTRLLVILASLACFGAVMKMQAPTGGGVAAVAAVVAPPAGFAAWKLGVLILLALAGWATGRWTRIPAGTFLVPTFLYFALRSAGIMPGTWPWPVLAAAYLVMGSQIGGRFHPSTVQLIRRVILPVIGTTLLLLLASVALAWIVRREMGISFASAYLAATPGGLDSVAAVATELRIDTTIVVAMHLVRLLCVLVAGPWLARGCTHWFRGAKQASLAA
jgi:membrane AbrB-like protein